MELCKEMGKSSEKANTESSLAKTEDKENKPGTHAVNPCNKPVQMIRYSHHTRIYMFAVADDVKNDDALEGRLNGDKDTLDEMDESRKEDKNGFKAKFMFNIADGGFTGKNENVAVLILNNPALTKVTEEAVEVTGLKWALQM